MEEFMRQVSFYGLFCFLPIIFFGGYGFLFLAATGKFDVKR